MTNLQKTGTGFLVLVFSTGFWCVCHCHNALNVLLGTTELRNYSMILFQFTWFLVSVSSRPSDFVCGLWLINLIRLRIFKTIIAHRCLSSCLCCVWICLSAWVWRSRRSVCLSVRLFWLPTGLQPDCLHGLRTSLRYVLVHPLSFF